MRDAREANAPPPDDDRGRLTLDVPAAANLAGVAVSTIYEGVRRGEIPSLKIGRRILIPRLAFERMLHDGGGRDVA